MADERVMVFIDGANLYMCTKPLIGDDKQIDIEKLSHKLGGTRHLERIYYYNTRTPSRDITEQKANQKFLAKLGWIDRLQKRMGRLVPKHYMQKCKCGKDVHFNTHIQKGVDTRIAVDLVTLAVDNAFDVAILISGDDDLTEAVNYIREHTRKIVENACTPYAGWSKNLREASDTRIPLTIDYLKDCLLKK